MAKAYRCRPSELLGLTSDYQAFCLDKAIWMVGSQIDAELDGVEGKRKTEIKKKRDQILRKWIPETSKARRYREPEPKG